MKLALLFPGQGSQYVGMCSSLVQKYPYAKTYFERADKVLDFSLSKLCFEGPEEELVKTMYTQPAILTCSIAMYEILKNENNLKVDFVAGHSLGEYSALTASGALNFEDAVKIVHIRGKLMQEAVPYGLGKMLAVRKCTEAELNTQLEIVRNYFNDEEIISVANFNSDAQIVVSGKKEAVELLEQNLNNIKIKSIALNVSAPFHSFLMKAIVPAFETELRKIKISRLNISYLANVDAKVYENSDHVFNNLLKQIPGSVLWAQSIKKMVALGVDRAIEVGPGKVLSKLCQNIEGSFECMSMDGLDTVSNIL